MKQLLYLSLLFFSLNSVENWQTVLEPDLFAQTHVQRPQSYSSLVAQRYQPSPAEDQCGLYKVGFTQDLYFQYIQYKVHVPELKEFTLCYWNKFTNHSNDHPIFSYALDGQPRAIYSWVSNTERSSYYSMAIEGHTFYRLNYPLRLNRWYHTCQSWNGKTGEWQIWVNAERVGRGFHNRLVGHSIPAGGIALTGQEQTQYGGGFQEGKGAGGILGEVTMVQLYRVALTAGKAHKDHKHHHAHEYDHNGVLLTTTPAPTPMPRPNQPTHPLLTGGQLNPNVALNIAAQQTQPQIISGQAFDAQLLNGQFIGNLASQQLSQGGFRLQPQPAGPQTFAPPTQQELIQQQIQQQQLQQQQLQQQQLQQQQIQQQQQLQQQQQYQFLPQPGDQTNAIGQQSIQFRPRPLINSGLVHPSLVNPANVQIIDTKFETHQLFKRHDDSGEKAAEPEEEVKVVSKRETEKENKQKKRELILSNGQLLDDSLLSANYDPSLLAGLAGIGQNEPVLQKQRQMEEREPAEAEVKAVMNVCTGCDEEPFGKALVFGWRTVPKKLYSGAFYTPAVPQCRLF